MKKVLITGGAGFMGSHIIRHLLTNTDWQIVTVDSFRHKGVSERLMQQVADLSEKDLDRLDVFTHDLKAPMSKQLVHALGKIDYILNLASESHVDRSIEHPRDFIENNLSEVLTMLEYARENPVEKFIQVSTDEVFGSAPDGYLHKETDPHKPSNPYSASKAAQEDICYSYWRTYDLPIVITNTMNIFGEMQDPEKFMTKTIKAIRDGETVTIHASKDGKQIGSRYYLHARNQADALKFILENIKPAKHSDGEDISRYNVVGEREVSNLGLAHAIARTMKKSDFTWTLEDFHSSRPGHDLRYALDGSKLERAGWKAPIGFEDSLKQTVKWTLENDQWLL